MQSQTLQLAEKIEQQAQEIFHEIDRVSLYNTQKVLAAFHEHRISEPMLHGTTGYGYDDHGRDALDAIYAPVSYTHLLITISAQSGLYINPSPKCIILFCKTNFDLETFWKKINLPSRTKR